ncbi:hypothetical protein A4G26_11170 [Mycobacterium kansasii]|nr:MULTISPECIES: hypothetical protein [Mycobacterium]KZS61296.1 hypothetical protein A4G26_11170 [Mycobacterium kansasii]
MDNPITATHSSLDSFSVADVTADEGDPWNVDGSPRQRHHRNAAPHQVATDHPTEDPIGSGD